jgi:hypothetical protein
VPSLQALYGKLDECFFGNVVRGGHIFSATWTFGFQGEVSPETLTNFIVFLRGFQKRDSYWRIVKKQVKEKDWIKARTE